ncbi:MAG: hypothetical protein H6704_26925 [Myxococcales bacterium]|nr:hypothetical protein [Myxococcales bacterium]
MVALTLTFVFSLANGAGDVHVSTYGLARLDNDGVEWVKPNLNAELLFGWVRQGPAVVEWVGEDAFVRMAGGEKTGGVRYDSTTGCPRSFSIPRVDPTARLRCGWHIHGDGRALGAIAATTPLMVAAGTLGGGWRREFDAWSKAHPESAFFHFREGRLLYPGKRAIDVTFGEEGSASQTRLKVPLWNTWSTERERLFVALPFGSEQLMIYNDGVVVGMANDGAYMGGMLDVEDPDRASKTRLYPTVPAGVRRGRFVLFRR